MTAQQDRLPMSEREHMMHVLGNAYGHTDDEVYAARRWAHAEIERLLSESGLKDAVIKAARDVYDNEMNIERYSLTMDWDTLGEALEALDAAQDRQTAHARQGSSDE